MDDGGDQGGATAMAVAVANRTVRAGGARCGARMAAGMYRGAGH
jgi:hypothetical protein